MESTVKCPVCGEPYVFYSHYAGDQLVCPDCVGKTGDPNGQTSKCPICGKPYKFYSHYAGDQSACGECCAKARNKLHWGEKI